MFTPKHRLYYSIEPQGYKTRLPSSTITGVYKACPPGLHRERSLRQNRALANGLFLTANFLVRSPGIWLLGSLADIFGLSTAFLISGLLAFASAPAVFWLPEGRLKEAM